MNPQFENVKVISELRSGKIFKDSYQDPMGEASTDASQNKNSEEEVSTKTNHIEELESGMSTDKWKKRIDELP